MELQRLTAGMEPIVREATFEGVSERPYVALNPDYLKIRVERGAVAHLVVLHSEPIESEVQITVAEGGLLTINELFTAEAFASVHVEQEGASRLKLTSVELGSANARYTIDLKGAHAESEVNGVFLTGDEEHAELTIRTNHLVADCSSRSIARGVAGGKSVGRFEGMVYVAQDAQRTDAEQQNRNLLLSEKARIETMPQLEIYADDVKCSHGATVGQLDGEAILYMRQRGLSEEQAKRMQIEGFLRDVVLPLGELGEVLAEEMTAKLERL